MHTAIKLFPLKLLNIVAQFLRVYTHKWKVIPHGYIISSLDVLLCFRNTAWTNLYQMFFYGMKETLKVWYKSEVNLVLHEAYLPSCGFFIITLVGRGR